MTDLKNKHPTSFDVARLAGVSRSAVSRAYTEGTSIAEETRRKVFEAAERLGYRVNALARGLQGGHSNIVGLVASRMDTPLRARQIKLLAQSLLNAGFRPMILTSESQADVESLLDALLSYNVAGIIVTSDTPPATIIEDCFRLAIPVVLINRDANVHWGDRVQMHPEEGGQMVFDLLRKMGASRFACLSPQSETFSVTGRAIAFERLAAENGLTCFKVRSTSQRYESGRAAVRDLQPVLHEIDGLFCATDLLALGALDGLRIDQGIRVPEQIQVVGFDDIEQASWGAYNLTTIRQDLAEQTEAALTLLFARMEAPDRPQQILRQTLVPVIRGTTLKVP